MRINKSGRFKGLLVSYDAGLVCSAGAESGALGSCVLVQVEALPICNAQTDLGWWGPRESGAWSRLCRRVSKRVRSARASRTAATFGTFWSSHRVSTVPLSTWYTFARVGGGRICRCVCGGTRPIGPTAAWACYFRSSVMSFVTAGLFLSISRMIDVWRGTRLSALGNRGRLNNQRSRSRKSRLANNSIRHHWQWGRA